MYGTCCLFPCSFPLQNSYSHTYPYTFFTFHWLFQFFSSRQLKRYLKLLLVYFYFSFAIWVRSCQTQQQHCCFCNGRWLRSKWHVLGLKWGSQFRISCHHRELGTWLRTPWGVDCRALAKADWHKRLSTQNNEITKPIHMQKNFPKAWKDKGGLWSFRRAVAVRLLRLSMSTQQGGLFRPFRFGSCLQSVFKFWPQVSEAASALAVAVSAKPLQHQASCFRLSKLLWLVLTLFRLLTLKLRYILSQFLYIAGRDGLFAK